MNNLSSKIGNLLSDESFLRWLSGTATKEEKEKWDQWVIENPQLYNEAHAFWRATQFRPSTVPQTDEALKDLTKKLNWDDVVSTSRHPHNQYRRKHYNLSWFQTSPLKLGLSIAAMLLIVMMSVWQFSNFREGQEFQTLTTRYGEQQQINLPDGSKIILNANSTIRYPRNWHSATKRQFFLTGEAYFEVVSLADTAQKTFTVFTADGSVSVLGTAFVVYQRRTGTRVTVAEGRVEAAAGAVDSENDYAAAIQLTAGEMVYFQKGDRVLRSFPASLQSAISWWKDLFILDQTPFKDVVRRLEETYGIDIEVTDRKMLERVLAGAIENRNLDVMIETLSTILQVPVYRQGKKIVFGANGVK